MVMVTESALRLAFDELSKVVVAVAIQTARFKKILKHIQDTVKSIEPVIYESRSLSTVLDRPQKETLLFISFLKREKKLVLKSSRIILQNRYQILFHSYKLISLNNKLVRFFQTELQLKMVSVDNSLCSVNFNSCFNCHLDEECLMDVDLLPEDEEMKLDISSENYSLPESNNRRHVKVLSITGRGDYPTNLHNLSSVARLPNLTTIRFEHVSISSLQPVFALRDLKQLSFVMCEIGDTFMSLPNESRYTLQNLTNLEIDMCYDLKQLPSGICNLVNLQKLSITNCHELEVLPKGLGSLSNLESLSLHCCTKLQELPESIGSLRKLSSIDISDCLSIIVLPEEIGEVCGLRMLKMNACTGLQQLPMSTSKLLQLKEVICDEAASYLWMDFESDLPNLKINVVEDDRLETFMKIVH